MIIGHVTMCSRWCAGVGVIPEAYLYCILYICSVIPIVYCVYILCMCSSYPCPAVWVSRQKCILLCCICICTVFAIFMWHTAVHILWQWCRCHGTGASLNVFWVLICVLFAFVVFNLRTTDICCSQSTVCYTVSVGWGGSCLVLSAHYNPHWQSCRCP